MRKIRKYIILVGILLLGIYSFSFQISDLKFGEKIKEGTSKSKEYILTNNTVTTKIYKLSIEGKHPIEITPNTLIIKPMTSKSFKLNVEGKESKGKHEYFLVVKEVNKEPSQEGVDINKTIRIKQEYIIE